MKDFEQYYEHECRCGEMLEVCVKLKDAGFESSKTGGEESSFEFSFGNLIIEIGQKS
jgi:hypothetical protein